MLDFTKIGIEDKEKIRHFLALDKFLISDISFGNLFIWRHSREIKYAIFQDCLIIETTYKDKNPFVFFPIGNGDKKKCLLTLKDYYSSKNLPLELHSLEISSVEMIKEIFPHAEAKLNRDRSDYLYLCENLINLSGRKYHKKKNHLNRFKEEFQGFVFIKINSENAKCVMDAFKQWSKDIKDDEIGLKSEYLGIQDALNNYEKLDFCGGYLDYRGEIIAFSFGERISEDLCIVHIEKADARFKGAYQAINNQLLKHCFSDIKYANREEDLGIKGLRKSKLSYHPDILLDKYEIVLSK